MNLDLGTFNTATGVTQFAGTDYDLQSITQDGSAPGAFTGISTTNTGAVNANYNNGRSVQIAQVPIVTFEAPDALQRQNGQAFTATSTSGVPITQSENQNGAGTLVTDRRKQQRGYRHRTVAIDRGATGLWRKRQGYRHGELNAADDLGY